MIPYFIGMNRFALIVCFFFSLINESVVRGQSLNNPSDRTILDNNKTDSFSGIYHIIMYGQSLMLGTTSVPVITTKQKYNTLMFSGGIRSGYDSDTNHFYDRLIPLVEKQSISYKTGAKLGETPASGFSETFLKLLTKENGWSFNPQTKKFNNHDFSLLISSPAQGSMSAKDLTSPGPYWERFKRDVLAGYKLATEMGKKYNVPFVLWNQGERDIDLKTSAEQYETYLKAFQRKADQFVKSVTHQKNTVWLVLYQTSSHNVRKSRGNPTIANAQYQLAKSDPYITMSNATYQLPYSKGDVHFTNIGSKWNGANHAIACKRILFDDKNWRPIFLKRSSISGDTLRLLFHVPVPPLVFDTSEVTNPGNYGFRLFDNRKNEINIRKILITGSKTVEIIAEKNVSSKYYLWYGNNGTGTGPMSGARGNLRDSQGNNISLEILGTRVRMDNWAPIFKEKL